MGGNMIAAAAARKGRSVFFIVEANRKGERKNGKAGEGRSSEEREKVDCLKAVLFLIKFYLPIESLALLR